MAGQLLLVNPRRRRRRNTSGRKRRRGPRRMSALQRQYFGKRRRTNPRRRRRHVMRSNPHRRHRRRSHVMSNPRRRRRRSNPIRHHRRRRRNPIGLGSVGGQVMSAAIGAVGALANDVIWGFLPVPATFKTGAMGTLGKAAATLGLGMLASKVVGRSTAEKMTTGALTVQIYGFVKPLVAAAVPTLPGLGYYGAGYALNEYISSIPNSLNAFVPNSLMGLGHADGGDGRGDPWDDTSNYAGENVAGIGKYIAMR